MLDSQRKYELKVRPLGRKAADEYYHNGSIWIEGRNGNSYTVDISNHTNQRALFIVSVDGLDVLKGKPAGPDSEGYVVDANSTVSIPGWKLNDKEAAEFFFSRNDDSYVNSIGGSTSNTGVIGAMVFSEMVYIQPATTWTGLQSIGGTATPSPFWNHLPTTNTVGWTDPYDVFGSSSSSVTDSGLAGPSGSPGPAGAVGQYSATLSANAVGVNSIARRVTYDSHSAIPTSSKSVFASSPVSQEIGTGFGDTTSWQTTTTTFTRANPSTPDVILAVYYNTARNLEKMGIQLRKRKDVGRTANAFPAYEPGCKPPERWKR
jgi:hypothetical protein